MMDAGDDHEVRHKLDGSHVAVVDSNRLDRNHYDADHTEDQDLPLYDDYDDDEDGHTEGNDHLVDGGDH